ncbi:hypothetical protein Gotri_010678 [Gossypium trilobum]|uniref:Uncharacterized protein n=1 Tax=Gossypium trilobum TaxID=34281 RepID=A0A7J9ERR2_9ROSI|nr:hypothetical protein [Gossypium trilobum]
MTATRFEFEKFDGETNFNLWQVRMMTILVQTDLKKVVTRKKPENLNQTEWEELDEKTLSAIQLCLANMVLPENVDVQIEIKIKLCYYCALYPIHTILGRP